MSALQITVAIAIMIAKNYQGEELMVTMKVMRLN